MASETNPSAPSSAPGKAHDTGIIRMKFEMSDCWIHLWIGTTEQWEAGPGSEPRPEKGWPDWAAQHIDLDVDRVVAVKCELKPEEAEIYRRVTSWTTPSPMTVRKMRRLRSLVLDAIEEHDDVKSVLVTAGGDGCCEFRVDLAPDPEDRLPGRMNALDPEMFVRMIFFDDADKAW